MYGFSPLLVDRKCSFEYEHVQASFLKYAIPDVPNSANTKIGTRASKKRFKEDEKGLPRSALIPKEIEYQVATRRKHLDQYTGRVQNVGDFAILAHDAVHRIRKTRQSPDIDLL